MPINLRLSASPTGTRNTGPVNMGGGSNLVQRSVFATNTPNLAYSQWYVPGAGSPAISTADYYNINGLYWARPYDLDTMGSEGATIKAREGMRYVWILSPDHGSNQNYTASNDFYVAYSNDPQIHPSPTTLKMLRREQESITVVDQNGTTQTNWFVYGIPYLVYNPDSAGDKFYIYAEGQANSFQHELGLFTTSDFLTTTLLGPAIPTTTFGGWTSFGRPKRLGVNSWEVYTFGKPDGSAGTLQFYKYTSTDGFAWTPNFATTTVGGTPFITVNGTEYLLTRDTDGGANDYLALEDLNASKQGLGTYTRLSTAFGTSVGDNSYYPGPTYLQDMDQYTEDGVASIYVTRGFFSGLTNSLMAGPYLGNYPTFYNITGSITSNVLDVTSMPGGVPPLAVGFRLVGLSGSPIFITSFGTGSGGTGTYNVTTTPNLSAGTTIQIATNGALMQQFVDLYSIITDSTAAANAAPMGVVADCTSGTVTISWNNVLPNNTYRVYRGTTVGTQATLIGDVTGTSRTDTPTAGSQYFYKVVTMNGGTEQKSRVVSVYASNNSLMVNRHVNRVINDGGDTSKIDFTFLASVDSYLTTNDYYKYLMHWVDARFGIKTDGSGFVSKVYCLGTTRMPKYGDYTPTTSNTFPSTSSNTSYSATSFRGTTPSFVNNAGTARGFFGNGRANTIQRKNEMTFICAYQKPGTSIASLFGSGQFSSGFYLQHASGSSGDVSFVVYQGGSPITATAAFASATAAHVAAGVFDGTNLTAYLDGVAGTPVDATAISNPEMKLNTAFRGAYGSIGSTDVVLMSGTRTGLQTLQTRTYNNSDAQGQFTCAGYMVFEKGLGSTAISAITTMYA